jgi:hypothetical protein
VIYVTKDAAQGSQYVWLTAVATDHNRITARPFVLVPGYYNLTYDYVSQGTFPALTQIVCAATPNVAMSNLTTTTGTGSNRTTGTAFSAPRDTNTLAAFIANGQIVSTPTSVAEGQTTLFTNPATDLSVTPPVATPLTTTAAVKMDNISLTNYTASTTSALLDICAYSSGWTTRSVNFEITKTGTYWLAFSTDMASPGDWSGGAFDDVRLTALGSPAMASPPSNPVVVPVPSPQNSTVFAFSGFEIVQDPIIFPAPIQ